MTTNTTEGAHRPENASRLYGRPPEGRPAPHHHGGGTPVAGAILADAWRTQAEATRADVEARRTLRSLRNRGR
jgi:hypothetical protein